MKFCGHVQTYQTARLHTVFIRLNIAMEFILVFGRVSVAARSEVTSLLGSLARIPLKAWMFVCCKCCALSGRGLCEGLITHPEESYRLL
jgi:hypothetical protein